MASASKRAKQSSILKTRYNAEGVIIEDANLDNDVETTRNLTGLTQRRCVSFSDINQVKEFEKSNSTTKETPPKTTDFYQTMCDDDMLGSDKGVQGKENIAETRRNMTRLEWLDMSVEGLLNSSSPPRPAAPTSGFLVFKNKLKTYIDTPVSIYEKWGFLAKSLDDLSKIADDEWDEILKSEKISEFLGDIYIKAVNVNRNRLNDPHPLYRGAMKRLVELNGEEWKM